MKKYNLVGIILSSLSCLAFLVISISESLTNIGVTSIEVLGWLGILVSATFIVFYVLEKKINRLLWLIPFIFTVFIASFFGQLVIQLAASIINIDRVESTETMSLVLTIYYIVSLVFALSKKTKWAGISGIVFASLMIFDALSCVITLVDLEQALNMNYSATEILYLIWPMLAIMLLSSAQILYFIDTCIINKEEKKDEDEEANLVQNEKNN